MPQVTCERAGPDRRMEPGDGQGEFAHLVQIDGRGPGEGAKAYRRRVAASLRGEGGHVRRTKWAVMAARVSPRRSRRVRST